MVADIRRIAYASVKLPVQLRKSTANFHFSVTRKIRVLSNSAVDFYANVPFKVSASRKPAVASSVVDYAKELWTPFSHELPKHFYCGNRCRYL